MIQNEDWPSVSIEEWHQSIRSMEEAERRQGGLIFDEFDRFYGFGLEEAVFSLGVE